MNAEFAIVALPLSPSEAGVVVTHLENDPQTWAAALHRAQEAFGSDYVCGIYTRQQVEKTLCLDW